MDEFRNERFALEHLGISVSDLERSVEWYKNTFGFELARKFDKPEFEISAALVSLGGIALEIVQPLRPEHRAAEGGLIEALRRTGTNHFALGVGDVAGFYAKLREAGADLVTELIGQRFFFCRDPDGTLIEVKQFS